MFEKNSSNTLLLGIVLGIIAGSLLGGIWPELGKSLKFIGEMFIKSLMMLVVPLVMASMVVGITSLGDIRHLGGIGGKAIVYYTATTAISVTIGTLLVSLIRPGYVDSRDKRIALRGGELLEHVEYSITGNKLSLLPGASFKRKYDNRYMLILSSGVYGVVKECNESNSGITVERWLNMAGNEISPKSKGLSLRIDLAVAERVKGKKRHVTEVLKDVVVGMVPRNLFSSMANNDVLPLIVFSLLFGAVLTTIGDAGKPVIDVFYGVNEAIMKIVSLLMFTAPIGIGALIAGRLGDAGGFSGFLPELIRLAKYAATVVIGLFIHGFLVLPIILNVFAKRNVKKYIKGVSSAVVTAFSTASSSATLPITMECTIENNKVSKRVASFVLPLGATINMDGTALYEAVSAVFIAQMYGIDLGFSGVFVIFLTATLAAIGAAGIPEAGLVTMVIVLQAVKLPIEGISMILVIDWLLDRFRTSINVWGDAVGAAVIEEMEK